jgi:hypothetical protein
VQLCACFMGTGAPEGGCTDDRQCCNGSCNTETGKCACDPDGSPCFVSNTCCSGKCTDEQCVA